MNHQKSVHSNQAKSRLIALTGASGFIGREFMEAALSQGWKLRILTRDSSLLSNSPHLEVWQGDLSASRDWTDFVRDVDVVVNCAGETKNINLMQEVNVEGPSRLLKAAANAKVKRWVQLSSVGVYGPQQHGCINEECEEQPVGVYETTKSLFDKKLKQINKSQGLSAVILRPSNVYGANMTNKSLFQLMKIIKRGLFFYIGPPGASANYVHVRDVVHALILCVYHDNAPGKVFNLSGWSTIETLIEAMAESLNLKPPTARIPLWFGLLVAYIFAPLRAFPLSKSRVNALSNRAKYETSRIERELGMTIQMPISHGIKDLNA